MKGQGQFDKMKGEYSVKCTVYHDCRFNWCMCWRLSPGMPSRLTWCIGKETHFY